MAATSTGSRSRTSSARSRTCSATVRSGPRPGSSTTSPGSTSPGPGRSGAPTASCRRSARARPRRSSRLSRRTGVRSAKLTAYKVVDVSARIAGIGSLGVPRYVALVEGDGSPDGNRLLDIKGTGPSSLIGCTHAAQPRAWADDARRVVDAQRRLQAKPTAVLDVVRVGDAAVRLRGASPAARRAEARSSLAPRRQNRRRSRSSTMFADLDLSTPAGSVGGAPRGCRLPGLRSASWSPPRHLPALGRRGHRLLLTASCAPGHFSQAGLLSARATILAQPSPSRDHQCHAALRQQTAPSPMPVVFANLLRQA